VITSQPALWQKLVSTLRRDILCVTLLQTVAEQLVTVIPVMPMHQALFAGSQIVLIGHERTFVILAPGCVRSLTGIATSCGTDAADFTTAPGPKSSAGTENMKSA
jgi:hypothetical protein